jgi:hypothetical protein
VIVVAHQHIGVDLPSENVDDLTEDVEEDSTIAVVSDDCSPGVSPAGQMPDRPGVIEA